MVIVALDRHCRQIPEGWTISGWIRRWHETHRTEDARRRLDMFALVTRHHPPSAAEQPHP
jgi:hypothetical protein